MDCRRTKVRPTIRILADLVTKPLEFAATNIGEVFAVGARRRPLVEKNWDLELLADSLAQSARENDTVLHRRSFQRNERNDIGSAHSRVLTRMFGEVDDLLRRLHAGKRVVARLLYCRAKPDDGHVVRAVG